MYKLFILLFIIFIINYFLLGVKEHYIDNIVLCSSDLKIFKNNKVLKEIQKGCPTTAAATNAAATNAAATTAAATTDAATTAAATTDTNTNKCFKNNGNSLWKCPSGDKRTIPCHYVCDGEVPSDCPNGEDEDPELCNIWSPPTPPSQRP